jgi:hypothetical protein
MSEKKTRTERFDESFKVLLIIMTVTFSGSLAFYKDVMQPRFFSDLIISFVFTIVIWIVSTLRSGESEYAWKTVAWWFLMSSFGTTFVRLYFAIFLLPPLSVSLLVLVSLGLTLPILCYLKGSIGKSDYRAVLMVLLFFTVFFVVFDILGFLGILHFPLNQ